MLIFCKGEPGEGEGEPGEGETGEPKEGEPGEPKEGEPSHKKLGRASGNQRRCVTSCLRAAGKAPETDDLLHLTAWPLYARAQNRQQRQQIWP